MIRIAIANTGKSKSVADYLPENYKVIGRTLDNRGTIIVGIDNAGWTLDDYVIPRLGSGLIACEEMKEFDGLVLNQYTLDLKRRGRKRLLTDDEADHIRHVWKENDLAWQYYRSNPSMHPEPVQMTITDLAKRYRVSPGVITHVLERTGAYA